MKNLWPHIIAILSLSLLCMGWVLVQFLAKKARTKNHFENQPSCGNCSKTGQCQNKCEEKE